MLGLVAMACSLAIGGVAIGQDDFDDEDDDEAPLFMSGLVAEYTGSDGRTHQRLDEVLSMDWGAGAPDLRVPVGNFSAKWSGRLQVWSTGEYRFRFFATGKVCLKVAGKVVLEGERKEAGWLECEAIGIEWGEQPIEIVYEKTGTDAQISFFWQGPDFDWEPVATHSLLHETEGPPDDRFQRGRFLARALRCAACHKIADHQQQISAPALDRLIGAISPNWIVEWLMEEPGGDPPSGDEDMARRMPHFSLERKDAEAIAAALMSGNVDREKADSVLKGKASEGRKLFLSVGCTACHRIGELGESGLFGGGDLSSVAEKRPADFFADWLKDPAALNRDHRMPVFVLSDKERGHLAAYMSTLRGDGEPSKAVVADAAVVARGKSLIQEHRCQQCHRLPNDFKPVSMEQISLNLETVDWSKSCAGTHGKTQPEYGLAAKQRAALRVYLSQLPQGRGVVERVLDGKFLMRERNCLGCHSRGGVQGLEKQIQAIAVAEHSLERQIASIKPPSLDSVGDKLHDKVLLDAISTRRPARRDWLLVRMPNFRMEDKEVEAIARYLIQEDRIPAPPKPEKVTVEELALQSAGSRLVTTDGFGCTSCHQIGGIKPTHVARGVHGPDLSQIGKEVRYRWFLRWVLNPARISPRMEMPAVKTPIRGVLGGRLDHQHAAVWAVLNQEGFQPPEPNPIRVIRQRNELGKREPAQVVIDNLEVGDHSFVKPLLVALTNRHNVLFDLEAYRLAGWWIGDTARQRLRKKYWYWEGAGTEVFPASKGTSEVALVVAGKRVLPTLDPAFPPEADERRTLGADWSFTSRVSFATEENEPVELRVAQTLQPFGGNEEGAGVSGFRRVVEYSGVPLGAMVELDVAPGAVMQVGNDSRVAKLVGENRFEVAVINESVRFESAEKASRVRLVPDASGVARVELEYRTSLPVDRYLQAAAPAVLVEQEPLYVIPGFDATRLALSEEMTPTAFTWDRSGKLIFATLKGEVWRAADTNGDDIEDEVTLVADGLSAPFGLAMADEEGLETIDVADKTALLRMADTDGDGKIDRVRTVASGWGHSTDYHGWIVGLPRDLEGNYYAVVTNRNGPVEQLRGQVMRLEKLAEPTPAHRAYRIKPLAMGLRFPVGIALSRKGALFVTDNQGQFNPYNELIHVVEGSHYGFFNLEGLEDTPEIKAMPKSGPTIGIPHPWVRSVNGICFLETPDELLKTTGKKLFGPFEGHLLGCEATTRQLIRVSLQKVGDRYQGAVYPLSIQPPRGASSLLRPLVAQIAPDGAVLVGSIHDSAWGAGRNVGEIVKMRFNGQLPTGIAEMRAVESGFELEFTGPIDRAKAKNAGNYVLVSYRRVPTPAYGGPDVDRRTEKIDSLTVSENGRRVVLTLPELRTGFVYELRLRNLTRGGELFHPAEAFYSFGPLE